MTASLAEMRAEANIGPSELETPASNRLPDTASPCFTIPPHGDSVHVQRTTIKPSQCPASADPSKRHHPDILQGVLRIEGFCQSFFVFQTWNTDLLPAPQPVVPHLIPSPAPAFRNPVPAPRQMLAKQLKKIHHPTSHRNPFAHAASSCRFTR